MHNISAVILAAGSGKRIGIPKLKLKHGENFFVNIIANKLKSEGINKIVCIIRKDDLDWFNENTLGLEYIINNNAELGMVTSVKLGVERYNKQDGILLFPVDHPFVSCNTIGTMINNFGKYKDYVIKPNYKGKSGHPLIVPNSLFEHIISGDYSKTLNEIIKETGIYDIKIDVDDEGILRNINSPDDLIIE